MQIILLYFFIAIFSTTLGSATGMGGGVIIKPLLDALNQYSPAAINTLSALTVLAMSLVSVAKQIHAKAEFQPKNTISLAAGSAAGGLLGGWLFEAVMLNIPNKSKIVVLQNSILLLLLIFVMVYMFTKKLIKPLALTGIAPCLFTGILLGTVSAFLGIGGGPINVSVIIFVFAVSMKEAALMSLVCILFSQISKISTLCFSGSFTADTKVAIPMLIGAVIGGYAGAAIMKKCREHSIEKLFLFTQAFIMLLCFYNITANIN